MAAPPNIASITQRTDVDSSAVDIVLIGEVDVHSFREEKNYVIDVAFQQAEKTRCRNSRPRCGARMRRPSRSAASRRGSPRQAAQGSDAAAAAGGASAVTSELIAEQARIEIKPGAGDRTRLSKVPAARQKAPPVAEHAAPVTENVSAGGRENGGCARQAQRRRRAAEDGAAGRADAAAERKRRSRAPAQEPAPVEVAKPATPANPPVSGKRESKPPPSRRGATATACA